MTSTAWRDADRVARLHGITWEEKCWLVSGYQRGICPLCLEPIDTKGANTDHCHDCENKENHLVRDLLSSDGTRRKREYGCKLCIRGALHAKCNGRMLPYLEKYPHLQNDVVKEYLRRRPFVKSVQTVENTEIDLYEMGPIKIVEKSS
jgi:hypothetical protein